MGIWVDTDFGFDDFVGWYGQISLGEIKPDFSEMVFRLWGTGLTDLWGKDYTGISMADDSLPDHWKEVEQPYMEAQAIGSCTQLLLMTCDI